MLSCVKNKARQGRRRKKKNERNKEEVWKKRENVDVGSGVLVG